MLQNVVESVIREEKMTKLLNKDTLCKLTRDGVQSIEKVELYLRIMKGIIAFRKRWDGVLQGLSSLICLCIRRPK